MIYEGNDGETTTLTWGQLHAQVCKLANVLKSHGIKKGDRVAVYMPMILELPISMLACARIGAMHTVVFGGFSAEALAQRIVHSGSKLLITADGVMRATKFVELKSIADAAMAICVQQGNPINTCIVYERKPSGMPAAGVPMQAGRDLVWAAEMSKASSHCDVEWMGAEDPLFMLYTSGSTGTPKGVLHTTGGYMVYAASTFQTVFDYRPGDVYWCTADCGWITGHTYIAYGPLLCGATQIVFEGVPNHPTNTRLWEIVDKHKVTQLYTAPTALRALMRFGDEPVLKFDLSSLRVLGSVGEPINPEAWRWYYEIIGKSKCPIVDTWWQTETGGIMLTPQPHKWELKPGSATFPFYGVQPCLLDPVTLDADGVGEPDLAPIELAGNGVSGHLCIKAPWPGMMRGLWGADGQERYEKVYFSQFDGYYCAGDGSTRDEDGYYWVTGRTDDVLVVSGHNIGTAEVESACVEHESVAEAAVVGFPHDIKGNAIYAYVTLNDGVVGTDELKKALNAKVTANVGRFAVPDKIQWAPALPKTRSGKIMRRILRKIADPKAFKVLLGGDLEDLGDTSTLAEPQVVDDLIAGAQILNGASL